MSYRLTSPDKWLDSWFSDLSITGKLLFTFLCDNCDNSGIYEINKKFMLFLLGMTEEELKSAFLEIKKCYVLSGDKKKIWLSNFLKHQKKLPLNPQNNAHRQIIMKLEEQVSDETSFKKCKEMIGLIPIDPSKIPTQKPKAVIERKTFEKPTINAIREFMLEKQCPVSFAKIESEKMWNFYESKNWKVGKEKMSVWKSACSNWIKNNEPNGKMSLNRKTKIDNIKESEKVSEDVDWNKVYKEKQ